MSIITTSTSLQPKNNKKKAMLMIAVILVLALVSSAYGYVKLDWFKTAKQVYFEAELKGISQLNEQVSEKFDQYYEEEIQPYLNSPVSSKQELAVAISGDLPSDPQAQMILDILKQSKITIESSADPKNQENYFQLALESKGNSLISAEVFAGKEKFGLSVPALYSKYAVLNLKDRDKLKERFGIDQLPRRFITSDELINALKLSKGELEPIFKEYGLIYAESLHQKQVSIAKGTFSEGDTKIEGRVITVNFTEDEFKNLVNKVADKLANDDKLVDLAFTRYDNLVKLYKDAGYGVQGLLEKDKAEFKDAFKDFSRQLKDAVVAGDLSDGVKMELTIDSEDQILDRRIVFPNYKSTIRIAHWTDKDKSQNLIYSIKGEDASGAGEINLVYKNKPENDKTSKGNLEFTVRETADGKEVSSARLTADFTLNKDSSRQDGTYNFKLTTKDYGNSDEFSGELKTSAAKNDKNKSRDTETNLKLNLDAQSAGLKGVTLNLNLKGTDELGKAVSLPKLEAGNTLDLANANDDDLVKAQEEIQQGFFSLLTKNPELLQYFGIY